MKLFSAISKFATCVTMWNSKRKSEDPKSQPEKRRKADQKFREEYTQKFPCIARSAVSANHVLCTVCKLDFKIAHGGMTDVKRHVK